MIVWWLASVLISLCAIEIWDNRRGINLSTGLPRKDILWILGLMIFALVAAELIGLAVSIVMGYIMHFAGSAVAKKFFKGTGNFEQQFYIAMLFGGAITILSALVNFMLQLIPFLGTLAGLTGMLFGLYSLYLLYLTVKSVQKIEMLGAVATIIVMVVAVVAIAIVVAVIGAILAVALGLTAAEGAVAGI
jgi:hypothetical protein